MDEKLKVRDNVQKRQARREEKMASIRFLQQLGNQKENSGFCSRSKNCKKHLRIRETNKGHGMGWFKGQPQISSPSSDPFFADSEVCSNWLNSIPDYLPLSELKYVKAFTYYQFKLTMKREMTRFQKRNSNLSYSSYH